MHLSLTPAQFVDHALRHVGAPQRRPRLLLMQQANQQALERLEAERLAYVEQGWGDEWQQKHERTTTILAEIERVLATC